MSYEQGKTIRNPQSASRETTEELKRIPLFAALSDEEFRIAVEEGQERRVARGDINAREGEPVEYLYTVLEGELRITKKVDDGEVVINTYGSGTFFAEVPLLSGTPFLASGRALTDCRLFLLPEATFRRLLTISAPFSGIILETMAERVQILQSVQGQREKQDSLNTLAAGLAHELNNPAAASRRAASRLRESLESLRASSLDLARYAAEGELGTGELEILENVLAEVLRGVADPPRLDPLEEGEREDELVTWLENHGLEDSWELASALAGTGSDVATLDYLAAAIPPGFLPKALTYLEAVLETAGDVGEVERGTARVSELVGAVRSYSYLDRAPNVEVNVNKDLESTLAVLGGRLGSVEVAREYDPNLPRISAYGGELNQVWTQLLENALDAIAENGEPGTIRLRTACEADRVLVEVGDNGPGIPEDLQARVFEPFYTTKGVGMGVGLGLDVSYRIVVGHHGGDIRVVSVPGDTRFQVRLPLVAGETALPAEEEPESSEN